MCRNNKNQQYNEEFMKRRVQKSRTALFLSLLWSAPTKLCNCRHLKHPVFYTITLFSFILHIFAMKTFKKHWTNKGRREDEMIIIWILKPWHYFAYYLNAYYLICDKRYLFFNFFFFFFWKKSPWKIYWNRAYSLSAIRLKINISMLVAISWRENFFFCFGWSSWNWFGSYVMIRQKFEILDFYVAHICNSICEVTLLNFA